MKSTHTISIVGLLLLVFAMSSHATAPDSADDPAPDSVIDPVRDEHLWAEKYSGKLEDIFEIQEQISRQIVDALKMQLSP